MTTVRNLREQERELVHDGMVAVWTLLGAEGFLSEVLWLNDNLVSSLG